MILPPALSAPQLLLNHRDHTFPESTSPVMDSNGGWLDICMPLLSFSRLSGHRT